MPSTFKFSASSSLFVKMMLKQQIAGLQEEFRRNESHWHAAHGKLKSQIEMLTKQNLELRDELRVSEHQRLEAEKKSGAVDFISRKSETPVLKDLLSVGGCLSSGSVWYTNVRAIQSFKIFVESGVMHQSSLNEQRTYGRKSPVIPVSHLTVSKETNSSSYIKGKISCKPYISMAMICGNFPPASSGLQVSVWLHSFAPGGGSTKGVFGPFCFSYVGYFVCLKVEEVLTDGRRIITFRNGTKKEVSADKRMTVVTFFNGDVKKIMPDQRVVCKHLYFFLNKKHHPDGTKEIVFPDQTVKLSCEGMAARWEGVVRRGRATVWVPVPFPLPILGSFHRSCRMYYTPMGTLGFCTYNGQKEIHTSQFKRREYPDGTIKTVYSSGQQETKYSSGRVRIKDEEGNIILNKK
uniref:Centromere protein J C-terminal domain-containing protein n=1 Tax=Gopherus evgoodei TaxID=1825980 RepID=A0A8C4Y2Y5_9SAUR